MQNIKSNMSLINKSIYFVIAGLAVICTAIFFSTRITGLCLNNETTASIYNDFNIQYNEHNYTTELPIKLKEKTRYITIKKHIKADELAGDYIAFYAYNSAINVYINDVQVYSEEDIMDTIGMARPSHWYFIKVPQSDFTLTITMASQLNIKNLLELHSGTKSALIYYLFARHSFPATTGVLALLCGIIIFFASLFIKTELCIRLRWLSIITAIAGIWSMCNSTILQIFISRGSFTSYIGYACYFLFPLTITGYLLTYETFADEKYFKFLYWIEFGSIIIITMLQLSHIIILSNVLWIVHIELITTFIMTIITFIRNHNVISKQETEIYTAFIIISVFLTMDILRYYSTRPSTGRVKYSIYGLFILLMYFAGSIFIVTRNNFVEHTRNRIYKELAFTDGMTKINNRSAFEVYMEKERNKPSSGGCIMIADLNNLKRINDTYGHRLGDEAIINTANLINDNFNDIGNCYRIGGDEFCVISNISDINILLRRIDNFLDDVKNIAADKHYPYSVATGYGIIDDSGIDQCFKVVDSKMYQNKRASKKGRLN